MNAHRLRPGRAGVSHAAVAQVAFLVVWPFGALVSALRRFRQPWAKTVFWLFCVYVGFVFVYADPNKPGGADSARYIMKLTDLYRNPSSLGALVSSFYDPPAGGGAWLDIYQPLTTWLVSRFTEDPRALFGVFAAVFGFFYAENIWLVLGAVNRRVGLVLLIFTLAFSLVNPIWNINGARMWTAAQIFLYGALRYFLKDDRRGLIWSAASILVHFSFALPVAVLYAWLFLPAQVALYLAFYLATSFVHEINLHTVRQSLAFMPQPFQPRIEAYTSDDYAESMKYALGELSWHVKWAGQASRAVVYTWVIALFFLRRRWAQALPGLYRLFLFALLLGGVANLASLIPSGGRFTTVGDMLFLGLFVAIMGQRGVELGLRPLRALCLPPLAYYVVFQIRLGLSYLGVLAFAGNPFLALFYSTQTPIIDYVKSLLL